MKPVAIEELYEHLLASMTLAVEDRLALGMTPAKAVSDAAQAAFLRSGIGPRYEWERLGWLAWRTNVRPAQRRRGR